VRSTRTHSEQGNWGRWGAEDERGTLNLITPESVLAAVRVPRSGRVFELGLPIGRDSGPDLGYRNGPQRMTLINDQDQEVYESFGGGTGEAGCTEDVVSFPSHSLTHVDALCHVYAEGRVYNGFDGTLRPFHGAARGGIENAGGVVARGVLVDVAASKGVECLDLDFEIGVSDLEEALDAQGTELRAGDAILIRTGWLGWFLERREKLHEQPGLGIEAAEFLAQGDPVLIGADNTGVECQPFPRGEFIPVHLELLRKHGILMAEHVILDELADAGCTEFLFIASPLPITGATGSPINPIAVG
jgi:kynurenine formamidase